MINIIILQQTHSSQTLMDSLERARRESDLSIGMRAELNAVAESQFRLAQFLSETGNDAVVIHEHFPGYCHGEDPALDAQARQLFPNGLPQTFQELKFPQKAFLAYYHGSQTAVHLGLIEKTYDDDLDSKEQQRIKSEEMNLNNEEISDDGVKLQSILFQQREYLTLKNAEQIAKQENINTVVLSYGRLHPFTDVAKCFPNLNIKIKDKSVPTKSVDYERAQAYEDFLNINRPMLDCGTLALGYNRPLLVANNETPSMQYASVGAAIVLGLVGIFGCYRYFSSNNQIPEKSQEKKPVKSQRKKKR